jgi:hypothetical protein
MRFFILILATCALTACGNQTPDETQQETTPAPEPQEQQPPCEVKQLEDGAVEIRCGDGDPVVLEAGEPGMNGEDGTDGEDGTSCKVTDSGADYRTISCDDGTSIRLEDGEQGSVGEDGEDGEDGVTTLVHVEREPAGMNCPDGGIELVTGVDEDGDGLLAESERANATSQYVCDARQDQDPRQLSAGRYHNCVLIGDQIKCWGSSQYGELGNGNREIPQLAWPMPVIDLPIEPEHVSAGSSHTCAIVHGGDVYCWGANHDGQLGFSPSINNNPYKPVTAVPLTSPATQLVAGNETTCALTTDGKLWCWGRGPGAATSPNPERPREIPLPFIPTAFDLQSSHACVLSPGGEVWCWGYNLSGQLGLGDVEDRAAPEKVVGLPERAVQIALSENHTCALLVTGEVSCWGWNFLDQLGSAPNVKQTTPFTLDTGVAASATHLDVGEFHTCVAFDDDQVRCWGQGIDLLPHTFANGIARLESGAYHICVLDGQQQVWCAGQNGSFQCGRRSSTNVPRPTQVLGF